MRLKTISFWIGILFLAGLGFCSSVFAQDKLYDFLIQNATVYDGKSTVGYRADVAISQETIAAVGSLDPAEARNVIDATNLVLAPGFIDAHTHSDFNPFIYVHLTDKITQGVTTEVVGNCGMSAAPILGHHGEYIYSVWKREGVQPPIPISWETFTEYRQATQLTSFYPNMVALVGHGNLRSAVMGFEDRKATPEEIGTMQKDLAEAMQEGAFGISFGLPYLPGSLAGREELTALCRTAGENGGLCDFHIRSEGSTLIESLEEAIGIGEEAGAPVQISHLKAGGPGNWSKIDEAFKVIEEARARGAKVMADAYPYNAGYAELGVTLPDKYYKRQDRTQLLRDGTKRAEILRDLNAYYDRDKNWDAVVIGEVNHPDYKRYVGRSIGDITRRSAQTPVQFLTAILADTNFEVSAFYFSQSQDVVDRVIAKPYVVIGSDSIADRSSYPHPRCEGTFTKVLRKYVREDKTMSLGEAVQKMSYLPAEYFGIRNRGAISPGYFADLVLFDPETIRDQADYQHPTAASTGIVWAFVNGRPAIRDGKLTGQEPGRLLLLQG